MAVKKNDEVKALKDTKPKHMKEHIKKASSGVLDQ